MKCLNEDCLHVFSSPSPGFCPRCDYALTERDKEQLSAEFNNEHIRPAINRTPQAIEWGGCDFPHDSRY